MNSGLLHAQCWVYQKDDSTNTLWGVAFIDSKKAAAVGDLGTLLRTTDGGSTWNSQTINISYQLRSIAFVDSLVGTAVGFDYSELSGLILRTTDGGATWVRQVGGTNNELWQESFPTENFGIVVGLNGTILRTTNGGSTWTKQSSGTTEDIIGVAMTDTLSGIAVGASGIILKTNNAGNTWSPQQSHTNSSFYDVSFTDANNGIAVGNNGVILRTSDDGVTWAMHNAGRSNIFLNVSFNNPLAATIVGWNVQSKCGVIFFSSDGGRTWDSTSCPYYLNAVASYPGTTNLAVGFGGTILHAIDSCQPYPDITPVSPSNNAAHQPVLTIAGGVTEFLFQWYYLPTIFTSSSNLQVADDSGFTNILIDTVVALQGSLLAQQLIATTVKPGVTYYWRFKIHFVDRSATGWSSTWNFTTAKGFIKGTVFEDVNRDTILDNGERALQNWQVNVSGRVYGTTFSDSGGGYFFDGLDSGKYIVKVVPPLQWIVTFPSNNVRSVVLGIDDTLSGINFGCNIGWDSVSGKLFDDRNENGILDSSEEGLVNWSIRVQGNITDSVLTDSNGYFSFSKLVVGSYTLRVVVKSSWEQIYPQLQGGISFSFDKYGQEFRNQNFAVHPLPPRVKNIIGVKDHSPVGYRNVWFGVRQGATYGIWGADSAASPVDFSEGEIELPPLIPGFFDARFVARQPSNTQFGFGSWTDMRNYVSSAQIDTYMIVFQPGLNYGGDYPMTFRWSSQAIIDSYDGLVVLFDSCCDVANMKGSDSIIMANPNVSSALIIAQYPRMPMVEVREGTHEVPKQFFLKQNYPNPFNPVTIIEYGLPQMSHVSLKIFNILGQEIGDLVHEVETPGNKSVRFDAGNSPSGMYFYRLTAVPIESRLKSFVTVKKMVVVK